MAINVTMTSTTDTAAMTARRERSRSHLISIRIFRPRQTITPTPSNNASEIKRNGVQNNSIAAVLP